MYKFLIVLVVLFIMVSIKIAIDIPEIDFQLGIVCGMIASRVIADDF